MVMNKAILHVLDFVSGVFVFSEKEMDVSNEHVFKFLEKHVQRSLQDAGRKEGRFLEESEMWRMIVEYVNGELDFITLSQVVANQMHDNISNSSLPVSTDVLVADVLLDDRKYLCMLFFENKTAFTHNVISDERGVRGEIVKHYSILPGIAQKLSEYAIVCLDDFSITFAEKKRNIDGKDTFVLSDRILQCTSSLSTKEAVKMVNKIVAEVTDEFGGDATKTLTKAKAYIAENLEESETLDPVELGRNVFSGNETMMEEFETKAKEYGFPEVVKVDRDYVKRSVHVHKIKTDTGIEITIPNTCFNNPEYVEFVNNEDGTISINLKNIGKITNR
jgi:nucleoid-associated protein YejK